MTEVVGDRVWFLDSRRAEGDGDGSEAAVETTDAAPELIGDPEETPVETAAES
jgi:hypothetical protein